MTPSDRVAGYLKATGWGSGELARRARVSPSTITRLLHGRKTADGAEEYSLGELVALKIERATIEAHALRHTDVEPLRAVELLPSRLSSTGTEG